MSREMRICEMFVKLNRQPFIRLKICNVIAADLTWPASL